MVAEDVAGNVDLLREILIRLPAKSLGRFKLVSKHWYSHISHPQIVDAHIRRNPNKPPTGIFLCSRTISEGANSKNRMIPFNALERSYQMIPSLSFLNRIAQSVSYIQILHSCNGLLLCKLTVCKVMGGKSWSDHYCVSNPTTKLFRLLPKEESTSSPWWNYGEFIAFDPSRSLHYKVICARLVSKPNGGGGDDCSWEILVYSSENHCWRISTCPFQLKNHTGVSVNGGAIYWLETSGDVAISFDVNTEKMITMPLSRPKPSFGEPYFCKGIGGGRLFCIDLSHEDSYSFRIFEMCLDDSSKTAKWVNKYEVSASLLESLIPPEKPPSPFVMFYCPLCVVQGVKEEELAVVFAIPEEVVWCDVMRETAKPLCELNKGLSYGSVQAFQYIESLYAV